eukprot:TRINITY_DN5469_c0_g1_i2.p1 TRINITY_DN5469_c0_g1~~TRINITY_DN5469_c0_g1_i2.p1  ORF type:complete len:368 (-),score=74.99 TRINITY_DN5469_c0_g1_i2:9-1112(-)
MQYNYSNPYYNQPTTRSNPISTNPSTVTTRSNEHQQSIPTYPPPDVSPNRMTDPGRAHDDQSNRSMPPPRDNFYPVSPLSPRNTIQNAPTTLYPTTHDLPQNMPINLYEMDSIPSTEGYGDLYKTTEKVTVQRQPPQKNAFSELVRSFQNLTTQVTTSVESLTNNVRERAEDILEDVSYRIVPHQQRFQGNPPASKNAIDALPIINIEEKHLTTDPQCVICMSNWKLGEEALELPCVHIFHEDCILPWLKMHNQCPICRYELTTDSTTYERYKRHKMKLMGVTEIVPPRKQNQQQEEDSEDFDPEFSDINIDISQPVNRTGLIQETLQRSTDIYNNPNLATDSDINQNSTDDIDKLLAERLHRLQNQ